MDSASTQTPVRPPVLLTPATVLLFVASVEVPFWEENSRFDLLRAPHFQFVVDVEQNT